MTNGSSAVPDSPPPPPQLPETEDECPPLVLDPFCGQGTVTAQGSHPDPNPALGSQWWRAPAVYTRLTAVACALCVWLQVLALANALGCDTIGIDTNRGRCLVAATRRPRADKAVAALEASLETNAGGTPKAAGGGCQPMGGRVWEGSLDPDVSRPVRDFWSALPDIAD